MIQLTLALKISISNLMFENPKYICRFILTKENKQLIRIETLFNHILVVINYQKWLFSELKPFASTLLIWC